MTTYLDHPIFSPSPAPTPRQPVRTGLVIAILGALGVFALSSCASEDTTAESATNQQPVVKSSTDTETTGNDTDTALVLPERPGPRRQTSGTVPHVQIDAEPDPELDAELRAKLFSLPMVDDLPSDRSLPGARGLALDPSLELARPDVIAGSKEFAHIHPDGSLHAWVPVDLAHQVHDQKWGELHPWVERDGFWDGVVMIFTPETPEEVDVTMDIVTEAYNFVTGASVAP